MEISSEGNGVSLRGGRLARWALAAIGLAAPLGYAGQAAGDEYVDAIRQRRAETDRKFADPESSPLNTFAVALLTKNETVIGSSASADVSCADCGLRGRHAKVVVSDGGFLLQPLQGEVQLLAPEEERGKADSHRSPVADGDFAAERPWKIGQRYRMGDLIVALQIHPAGPVLRLIRPSDQRLRHFKGLKYWPVDPRWRVKARIEPAPPRELTVLDTKGWERKVYIYGKLHFDLDDRPQSLDLILFEPNPTPESQFMLIFQDATSGRESYPACRYLYLPFQKDGETEIDFNLASNPFCAYGGGFACPLPLPGNRLSAAVEAGEKKYSDDH